MGRRPRDVRMMQNVPVETVTSYYDWKKRGHVRVLVGRSHSPRAPLGWVRLARMTLALLTAGGERR